MRDTTHEIYRPFTCITFYVYQKLKFTLTAGRGHWETYLSTYPSLSQLNGRWAEHVAVMTARRLYLFKLGGLLLLTELVSINPAEGNPFLDCDYLCDPNNGYPVSCQRYCPGHKQQPDPSAESHDTSFPTVTVVLSIVSTCVVITVVAVVIYKFRNKTCNRLPSLFVSSGREGVRRQLTTTTCNGSVPSRPCQKFKHPLTVTVEENSKKVKLAGKVEEYEMQTFFSGNTDQ